MGLILPALVGYVYIERFNLAYTFEAFDLDLMGGIISKILQVGIFPNLALLFVFYTLELWRTAKGILLATVPYLLASFLLTV